MDILILSKTKYGTTRVCVGGICILNKQFVRLLTTQGQYQPADTKFEIGAIWSISFNNVSNKKEPHNEDIIVLKAEFLKKIYSLETYIKNLGVPIWEGSILNIFEGKIRWTRGGKGYLSENISNYPSHSVGFWCSDVDLKFDDNTKCYVYEKNDIKRNIIYKGNQAVLASIPGGKLIRLSLAKWWKPEDLEIESRCYLQLSGWYEDVIDSDAVNVISRPPVKIENITVAQSQNQLAKSTDSQNVKMDSHLAGIRDVKSVAVSLTMPVKLPVNIERDIVTTSQRIVLKASVEPKSLDHIQSEIGFNYKVQKIATTPYLQPLVKEGQNATTVAQKCSSIHRNVSPTKNTSGPCYIASLCYGSYYAEEVCTFRDFRDNCLKKTFVGRKFIVLYYRYSPLFVSCMYGNKKVHLLIKNLVLKPLLRIIKIFALNK